MGGGTWEVDEDQPSPRDGDTWGGAAGGCVTWDWDPRDDATWDYDPKG